MKRGINPNGSNKKQRRFHQPKPDASAEVVRCSCESKEQLRKVDDGKYLCGKCREV